MKKIESYMDSYNAIKVCPESEVRELEAYTTELEKKLEGMECCENCDNGKCEWCIRYEDNGDEGREFQDYWKLKGEEA